MAGLLLIWSQQPLLGALVIVLGTMGPVLLGVLWFTYKARARAHQQHLALHALRKGDPKDKEAYTDLIETLFLAHDADGSGKLSQKELRGLLKSMCAAAAGHASAACTAYRRRHAAVHSFQELPAHHRPHFSARTGTRRSAAAISRRR